MLARSVVRPFVVLPALLRNIPHSRPSRTTPGRLSAATLSSAARLSPTGRLSAARSGCKRAAGARPWSRRGRISLLNGDVSVRRGDSGDYVAATQNAPMMVQDSIQTGAGARAEVQFDSITMVRLAQNTEVHFTDLQNRPGNRWSWGGERSRFELFAPRMLK